MNIDYTLRIAIKNDIYDIMEIEKSSFNLEICEPKSIFLERIDVFPEGFYVIESNKKVIGYISTELWDYKEEIDTDQFTLGHSIKDLHNAEGNELYISSMGILPIYRGIGLGKILFNDAISKILEKSENVKSQILIVSENWGQARKIYKRNGFLEVKYIKDFLVYNNNLKEDFIVMRKLDCKNKMQ
ncbi:GNAT family N-acetyltransferase [Vallitalea okinawensis]|uniref:GNAT family N-acetyltransferase n=1 Tax=Vallitalea okinawensis TaxID=2078660 RepID=UPI000CFB0665|nr:N-acetyltransferase [Vallitalea okinawensis]